MPKRKKTASKKQNAARSFKKYTTLLVVVVLALGLFSNVVFSSSKSILGSSALLAKGGDDSGGGSSNSGSGSSDSVSRDSSSGSSGSGSSGSGISGSSGSSVSPTRAEIRDATTGIRTQTETTKDETRTEVRLSESERIRTRTKDGRTRIDITSGGIKTRLEVRDDRVVVKAEQEDGTQVELEDESLVKIDDRLEKDNIKVTAAGGEKFLVQKGTVGAVTNFPVSIDLATNTLFINTPAGQKTVAILPDQAVKNLIAANIVNRIGGQAIVDAVKNGNISTVSELITLGEKNGVPVYEINGISDQKLLSFIPVKIERKISVSAETGEVVSTNESFADRILDFLSI